MAAAVEGYTRDLEFRLRPSCMAPSPFSNYMGHQLCDGLMSDHVDHYKNGVIAADNAHDEILPIHNVKLKGGNDYENNMMTHSKHHTDKTISEIFNTFGSINLVPNSNTPASAIRLNENMCHIVDIFSGSYFCPGYNNYIDCADKSYKNFLKAVDLKNPLKNNEALLFQQNPTFKFTALMNYDLLLYAALIHGDTPIQAIPGAIPGDTLLQKAINMNISVMNFFWKCLLDETQKAIETDFVLQELRWKDYYLAALAPLRDVKFTDILLSGENIDSMKWVIDGQRDNNTYLWGITQGTSASSILKIIKNLICCIPRGEGKSKRNDKISCSDGLDRLIELSGLDNEGSAALHAICKFIGDTSHITFGNIVQLAKENIGGTRLNNLNILRSSVLIKRTDPLPANITPAEIESIIIHFWISERPMATRICLDEQHVKEFAVGLQPTQIIKNLYTNSTFDSKLDQYLLVDFDKLKASKAIINDLNNILTYLNQDPEIAANMAANMAVINQPLDMLLHMMETINVMPTGTPAEKANYDENVTIFNTNVNQFINDNSDVLNVLKNKYKSTKLTNDINLCIVGAGRTDISKVVEIFEMGSKQRALRKSLEDNLRSRSVPLPINANGWTTLNKQVKKKKIVYDEYIYLTKFVSLLLEYLTVEIIDSATKREMITHIYNSYVDLHWVIINLGNLYSKHAGNMYSIISTALATTSNQESDDFCLNASNFIENVVKLSNLITKFLPQIGGGNKDIAKELMIRGLGCSLYTDENYGRLKLKRYVLSLLNGDEPIYLRKNRTDHIYIQYLEDYYFLYKNCIEKIITKGEDDNDLTEWYGPFKVVFFRGGKNKKGYTFEIHINDNLIETIIETVIEYDIATITNVTSPTVEDKTYIFEKIFKNGYLPPYYVDKYNTYIGFTCLSLKLTKRYMYYLSMIANQDIYNPNPFNDAFTEMIERDIIDLPNNQKILNDYHELINGSLDENEEMDLGDDIPPVIEGMDEDIEDIADEEPPYNDEEEEELDDNEKSRRNRENNEERIIKEYNKLYKDLFYKIKTIIVPKINQDQKNIELHYATTIIGHAKELNEKKNENLNDFENNIYGLFLIDKNILSRFVEIDDYLYRINHLKMEIEKKKEKRTGEITASFRPSTAAPLKYSTGTLSKGTLSRGTLHNLLKSSEFTVSPNSKKTTVPGSIRNTSVRVGGTRIRTRKHIHKKKKKRTRRLNKRLKKKLTKHKKKKAKKYTRRR